MVLSNKKLKQKLREAKTESLITIESRTKQNPESNDQSLQASDKSSGLEQILQAARQRQRVSRREKRKKIQSLKELEGKEGNPDSEIEKGSEKVEESERGEGKEGALLGGDGEKKKKRKREESGSGEKGLVEEKQKKKKKNEKKKKKFNNNKKKKNKANGGEENMGVESRGVGEDVAMGDDYRSQVTEDVSTKVYVGGIPYYSTEDDIRSFFDSCGTITEVDCMKFPDSGKFRGIAIISFKTEAAAKRALVLDGADMGGFYLKTQPYKTSEANKKVPDFEPRVIEGYNRIYVGNLSWDITEEELKKFFSDCNISSIRFGVDKETGEFRGYVHIDLADNLSLVMALKLDQQLVCGRPIKINYAVPKKGAKGPDSGGKLPGPRSDEPTTDEPNGNEPTIVEPMSKEEDNNVNGGLVATSGKIRRRTCYECGKKGHLYSDCPNKKAADATNLSVG